MSSRPSRATRSAATCTSPTKFLHAPEDAGLRTESAEIAYIPTTLVPVTDVGLAKTLIHLHESLDEDDDVQQVFPNEEVDDAVSEAANQPT